VNTKKELESEYSKKFELLRKERDEYNNKFNQKKKDYKELEQKLLKQTCAHEKESGENKDKISNMEQTIK